MVSAFAVVVPAWKVPTIVEDACDTKPAAKVARPESEREPSVSVPTVAVLALRLVVVAPAFNHVSPPKVDTPVLLKVLVVSPPLKVLVAGEPKVIAPLMPLIAKDATDEVASADDVAR